MKSANKSSDFLQIKIYLLLYMRISLKWYRCSGRMVPWSHRDRYVGSQNINIDTVRVNLSHHLKRPHDIK